MNYSSQKGMTLVELVVTLAVVAILASIAAPSLQDMVANNRLLALNNQLVSALNYARGEAVKRVYDVSLCVRNSDGSGCATSGGFEKGWLVFVNCNADTTPDTAAAVCDFDGDNIAEAPELILADTLPDAKGIAITSNNTTTPRSLSYKANGNIANSATLTISIPEGEANAGPKYQVIIAATTGRIRSCKIPAGQTGC